MNKVPGILFLIVLCLAVTGIKGESKDQSKGTLTIVITGITSNEGLVRIALFNSESAYIAKDAEPFKKISLPIKEKRAECEFKEIPYGEYAIKVYHDENANGIMDKNIMGIPKEDYAFSNNASGTFGPAKYDKAKFEITSADLTTTIKMTSAE
jgi:uncharacterized protein (DUF2141 family)